MGCQGYGRGRYSRKSQTGRVQYSKPTNINNACDTFPHAATHLDKLEQLKVLVTTAARAFERLLYAQSSCAYAIRYVDDAREFFQLPEEVLGDQGAIITVRCAKQGLLSRGGPTATAHKCKRREREYETAEGEHR